MTTTSVERQPNDRPAAAFDVRTARADATRANVHVSGHLDAGAAVVLAHVIDGHLSAGRRFLRLHIGGVRGLSPEAIQVIAEAHEQLLARRGTMILTGVSSTLEDVLRAATLTSPLLMIRPTAAEQLG